MAVVLGFNGGCDDHKLFSLIQSFLAKKKNGPAKIKKHSKRQGMLRMLSSLIELNSSTGDVEGDGVFSVAACSLNRAEILMVIF